MRSTFTVLELTFRATSFTPEEEHAEENFKAKHNHFFLRWKFIHNSHSSFSQAGNLLDRRNPDNPEYPKKELSRWRKINSSISLPYDIQYAQTSWTGANIEKMCT